MGILNRLFDGRRQQPLLTDDEMQAMEDAIKDARRCVAMYNNLMNCSAFPKPGYVADARKLPVDKSMLKSAFKMVIRATKDIEMKSQFKKSYITLANFQIGIGLEDLCIDNIEYYNKITTYIDTVDIQLSKQCAAEFQSAKILHDIVCKEYEQLQYESDGM